MNVTIQPQTVKISIGSKSMGIGIESPIAREIIDCDPYIGEYEITPNNELQILPTKNLRMLKTEIGISCKIGISSDGKIQFK